MKIAYIINSVEGGGAALPLPAVIDVLTRQGIAVEVLALIRRDGLALPSLRQAGVKVHVREGGEEDHRAALLWIARKVAELRPDALWTSLTRATLLGQLVGIRRRLPVVSWQHAAFLRPANRQLLRIMRRGTTLWVADSQSVAAATRARLGVPDERMLVWPLFRADPDVPRAALWRRDEPIRIGSLGRLHRVKGFDVLLDALGRLDGRAPIALTLAGEGRERPALEQRIAELGLPVTLPGFVNDAAAFLASQHLYVQPSRSEGLCIAAHQAMAAGLPVLASAVGELPNSIVTGTTGITVAPGDPGELARALGGLLLAPERLHRMGDAARTRVLERFGPAAFDAAGALVSERLKAILAARATSAAGRAAGRGRSGRSA